MQPELTNHTLNLADEGLLAIRDGQTSRIRCHEGTLWITEEGEVKDTIVSAGETYTIRHRGLALLTSLGISRITIEGPAGTVRSGRSVRSASIPALASCG